MPHVTKSTKCAVTAAFGIALLGGSAIPAYALVSAQSWELASEFSDQQNPNTTVWSYGYESKLNGSFVLLSNMISDDR
jgi:hypothetical protein